MASRSGLAALAAALAAGACSNTAGSGSDAEGSSGGFGAFGVSSGGTATMITGGTNAGGGTATGGTYGSGGTIVVGTGAAAGSGGFGAFGGGAGTGGSETGGMAGAGGNGVGGGGGLAGAGGGTGGRAGSGTGGAVAGAGGSADSGTSAGMSSGCGKTPTIASGQYNNGHHIAIMAASMQREYILNVPANYDDTHPYRLVIAYHELNGNDDEMYNHQYYHLLSLSNDSAIFVAPNGQQNGANCTQASGCGWPNPNDSDMLLADAVVTQIEQNFCVDTNRIFATGWSFGASMSYETACERPLGGTTNGVAGYIRAIAGYSAAELSGSCKPQKPVAYYASHGTGDAVLCYDSTSTNCSFASGGGGVGLAQNYAMVDGCTWMTPTKVTSGNHMCTNLMGCMTGYPVEFCSFNGPHTPDPTDPGQFMSWEYQNVWTFLSQF